MSYDHCATTKMMTPYELVCYYPDVFDRAIEKRNKERAAQSGEAPVQQLKAEIASAMQRKLFEHSHGGFVNWPVFVAEWQRQLSAV